MLFPKNARIKSSGAFYFSAGGIQDWTSPQNGNLWQDAVKALFDPCPAGWRVPKSGEKQRNPWINFSRSGFTGGGVNISDPGDWAAIPNTGYRFYCSGVSGITAWYPASNRRQPEGTLLYEGKWGSYWSSSLNATNVHTLTFNQTSVYLPGSDARTAGFSVRCVRE